MGLSAAAAAPSANDAPEAAADIYNAPQGDVAPTSYDAPAVPAAAEVAAENYSAPQSAPENYGAPEDALSFEDELSVYGNRIQPEVVDLTGYQSQQSYAGSRSGSNLRRSSRSNLRLKPLVVETI